MVPKESAIAKVRTPDSERRIAELEEALARQTRISAALREIGQALGTTMDLDQVLELILQKITETVDADRATLYLLDEARGELVSRIAHGSDVRAIRLLIGEGIAGHVAKTGRTSIVRDAYKDPRFSPQWDLLSGYTTRSILAAPMKNHLGKTIGVVQVLNKRAADFTEDDAELLLAIATQAAIGIDNSRLFLETVQKNLQLVETKEQLLRRVRDLKLLFSLESAMARAHSLEELFMAVLGEAMRSCEARAAAVALREPGETEGDESSFLYLVDDKHRKLRRFRLREGQGLIGWSMKNGEVLLTDDAPRDPRTNPELEALVGFHSHTALIVPLEGEDRSTLGAIALYNKRDGASPRNAFTVDDRSLLELIAANASTAIRLQMAREQHEREERLTTIGRLLSAVIHDLRTPLGVISGTMQMMQAAESPKKRAEYAASALKQFDLISAMQREVLEFARGERSVLVRKVYLQKFFDDVRQQIEPQLKREGVELVIDLQDKGTARFDESKILRLIHNLARNATEAMASQAGGRFSIRVARARAADELVLTFADTGPGIPHEIEHRLFRSFVTANKKGGTGLGLAIVKKIAEDHGGRVSVRSTKRGATFEVRLPQEKTV